MKIQRTNSNKKYFWAQFGRIFGDEEIYKEIGNPVLNNNNKEWFVATEMLNVIGFVCINRKNGKIQNLYVYPDSRKKGVARRMLIMVLKYAHKQALLPTVVASRSSFLLFKSLGFFTKTSTRNYHRMELGNGI